nr:MAG TPA_asm: hypothetical protein [Caudoviricetes sp.]
MYQESRLKAILHGFPSSLQRKCCNFALHKLIPYIFPIFIFTLTNIV